MKIIKIYIVSMILFIVIFILGILFIGKSGSERIDASYINEITHEVNSKYSEGIICEDTKNYRILLISDTAYDKKINDAINDNCVIMDIMTGSELAGKIIFDSGVRSNEDNKRQFIITTSVVFILMFLLMLIIGVYLYITVIRPFLALKAFARNIATGNLDVPLNMNKDNYFGAFTESFDLMREELSRARKSEYEANKSKKELVASLSHDIKTPVSTIKALCEILEVKLEDEDHLKKVKTISGKADIIDLLISDMFNSTLEDLNVLQIQCVEIDSSVISQAIDEMNHDRRIVKTSEIPSCLIWGDALRINQIIDNVINNSYKYGTGMVYVSFSLEDGFLMVKIKDEGCGVDEKDLALVCQKFFRGKNAIGQNGSGLGLYLVKSFIEGMKGYMDCYNEGGFVVELRFKLV